MHVCKVHSSYGPGEKDAGKKDSSAGENPDVLNLGFKPFDATFMRSFIRRAKSFEPTIDDTLQRDIVDAYVSIRDDEKRGDVDSRKSYTTPRTLLAILRLSQAHARCRFSPKVEREDFAEAMRLTRCSKESVEISAPKGNVNPLDIIYDIVQDFVRRGTADGDGWIQIVQVVSMAAHKALNQEQVIEALENWES